MIDVEHEPAAAFGTGTVGDAMSRGVISCPPETPLRVVARMMATFGVHAIFVFEHTDEDDEAPPAVGRRLRPRPRGGDEARPGPAHGRRDRGHTARQRGRRQVHRRGRRPDGAVRDRASRRHRSRPRPPGVISTLDIARAVAAEPVEEAAE